ncbi:MAG: ABC transporter ATP-binding protein [Acidimicrobiia bacterium]
MIVAFRTLRRYLRAYRRGLVVGVGFTVLEVAANLAQPWPLGIVVDRVLQTSGSDFANREILALAALGLLVLVGLAALADYWSTRLLAASGLHLANDVRGHVFAHLHRLSLGYHGEHQVGDLSTRVTSDVDRTQDMLVQSLSVLVPNSLLVVGMFSVMVIVSPFLTVVALLVSPVMVIGVHRSTRALRATSRRARKADGQVAAATTESLGAIHLVQAFSLEHEQHRRFSELNAQSLAEGLEAARLQARFSPVVDITSVLSTVAVLWFGGNQVMRGEMRLGVLLVFLSYLGSLYKPVKQLSKLGTLLSKGSAAAERVSAVLEETPRIDDVPNAVPLLSSKGAIGFHGVSFSYGREPVLDQLELFVASGETVALVGPTGAGKSTIAALVPRLVDPDAGFVSIDGRDVRTLTLASVRAQVSMVLQDSMMLRGTIRDNIAIGRPGASTFDIEKAARLALVDEFSGRLPNGLSTAVGERGANLSGGQRQRIAIARAILRDAPILILDEPTSALDATSEQLIVEALANLPKSRTTLVIAHRLSTIRRADRIAVIADGRVAELGSHDDLRRLNGRYGQLAAAAR